VAVVPRNRTRPLPTATGQQPSKIREGCFVEIHLPPLWIPARVVQHNPEDSNILYCLHYTCEEGEGKGGREGSKEEREEKKGSIYLFIGISFFLVIP
jgi:hypothetical protein